MSDTVVESWLESPGPDQYTGVFWENVTDSRTVPHLDDQGPRKVGASLGNSRKLLTVLELADRLGILPLNAHFFRGLASLKIIGNAGKEKDKQNYASRAGIYYSSLGVLYPP